jgi:tetrahydromethanopterin S-methyltransferase subunit G
MRKTAMTLQDARKQHSRASFEPVDRTEQILERAVLRLNANILGLVLGIVAGLAIFAATNFLILKGGSVVGPHLGLLRAFFPFYSVTFPGSIVGFGWGLLSGYVAGFIVASIYNLVVKLKSG